MNKEKDYASDTDESDEDFRPEDLAGESPVSEDDESESNEEQNESVKDAKKKPVQRKRVTKKVNNKRIRIKQDESEDDENTIALSTRASRQTHGGQTNGKGKSLETNELVSDDEDKLRTNALWADFLMDVNPVGNTSKNNPSKPSSSSTNGKASGEKSQITKKSLPQTNLSPKVEENKIVVTEVVDFAGEEVRIEREVDASSVKENKAAAIPPVKKQPFSRIMPGSGIKRTVSSTATASTAGLGSIINQLGKKKKLSVLEKSQMDWKSFKQSEGIDEQIQTFNKGKDGYLERQDFLQRTDLRQFEIEKNLRQTTRRPF